MRLNRLCLRNFKGAREVEITPAGQDLNIFGDNATGKTTVADGLYWLLFGKDSENRADFEIKTLDAENRAIPAIDHSVEAEFETETGALTLAKVYRETYVKRRGAATSEFTGHATETFVNGVPVAKKEFDAKIDSICSERQFRMLTDPTFFASTLSWQERRKTLLQICGDVTDDDVIAANPSLSELPKVLGSHRLEEFRKILESRRKAINEELSTLPARVDEATRALPLAPSGDPSGDLLVHQETLRTLQERRASVASGGALAEKMAQLRGVEREMVAISNRLASGSSARSMEDECLSLERRIADAERDLARKSAAREAKLQEFNAENARAFSMDESCPTCGQSLPPDRVERARTVFVEAKAARLAQIQTEGKALRASLDLLSEAVEAWRSHLGSLRAELADLKSADPLADPEYQAKAAEKASLVAEIEGLRAGVGSALEAVDREIAAAQSLVNRANAAIASSLSRKAGEKRIAELTAREAELSSAFERIEGQLFLMEEFVRAQVSLLTDRINSRFSLAQFKLFAPQINGGLAECCEVMVQGVPYGSLNHGARVNVGLDIINVLASHCGFAPPIVVDNAESVTSLLATRGQQIRLVVSASDSVLRVETVGSERVLAAGF